LLLRKSTSLAENVSSDVLIDKIHPAVFPAGDDKKKGKEWEWKGREGTQSHKTLYFRCLWGGHPWGDLHKIWHACCTSRMKMSNVVIKFQGFRSTGQGSNSPFSIDFAGDCYNGAA